MKNLKKIISWWLVLPFFSILFLIGCQAREKNVKKTETKSEKKTEANYKIEDKTFEIVLDKSILNIDYKKKFSSEESNKSEKKNVDKGKEYYENGNLKKEWERDLSELSESTKKVFEELEQKINSEKETSKYWENSSNHYYQLWQQEKAKSKSKEMQLKTKPKFPWFWLGLAYLVGLFTPTLWRWFKAWLLRFNPYLKLVEKIRKVLGKFN